MLGSFLHPVVCRSSRVFLCKKRCSVRFYTRLFVGVLVSFCVCFRIVVSNTSCVVFFVFVLFVFDLFVFVLCLVCPMLPVFLDCLFLIACSVFSDVYETFNQWWITIPSISTKRTITSHLNSLNRKQYHVIWHWKSRSWLGTSTNMWRG